MKRSAIDCLRRASQSLRSNGGLIPLALLQHVLVGVLFVVSLAPPFLVLGGMALLQGEPSVAALEEWLAGLATALAAGLVPLALAVLASFVLGILAVYVWGWFQGGMLGVLVAAERQAPSGAEDRAGGWRWFRTFSVRDFAGWGGRYAWRFFWFFHLSLTVSLLLVLAGLLIAFAAGVAREAWGLPAAYGIGCGASLPLLFGFVVYALWNLAAQPAVALPESGTLRGARIGLRVVGRRPGAVLLIFLAFVVVSVVAWLVLAVAQAGVGLLVPDDLAVWIALYGLFSLVQWTLSAALTVFATGGFASLVVSEAAGEAR